MLSDLMNQQGELYAFDISKKRLETLRENLSSREHITVQCLDARDIDHSRKFDTILLDVHVQIQV